MKNNTYCFILVIILTILFSDVSSSSLNAFSASSSKPPQDDVLTFLLRESAHLSALQEQVGGFLRTQGIFVGNHLRPIVDADRDGNRKDRGSHRIAISTMENPLECRITLGQAEVGSKVIAPCLCSGSQEWVQFSELNRLRRKDPGQWKVCPTCQGKFDFSMIYEHGGVKGNLITLLLDNKIILRSILLVGVVISGCILRADKLAMVFLTSRMFWQLYPQWSRLVELPIILKYWGAKIVFGYLSSAYLFVEGALLGQLTELETAVVEARLPVDSLDDDDDDDGYDDDGDDDDDSEVDGER